MSRVQQALEKGDRAMLLEALRMAYLSLRDVKDENVDAYYEKLQNRLNEKKVRDHATDWLGVWTIRDLTNSHQGRFVTF